jgi:hypothetical protein
MVNNRPNTGRPWIKKGAAALGILLAGAAVVCLWQSPNQAEAAMLTAKDAGVFKDKDKLLITLNVTNPEAKELRGTLKIELVDAGGKSVGKSEQEISQKEAAAYYRFQLPLTGLPADQVTLRCHLDGKIQFAEKVSELLFAKAHETSISSGQEFTSGSTASMRLAVRSVKSMTESIPVGGAEVNISLKGAEKISAILYSLYKGKTGADGSVTAEFKVPALPAGNYKLAVATKSAFGEETLERDVRVKNEGKVLLVTDKPLYQPGQLIHIRALALRPFDLAPMSKKALTFEVEDSKGNKVFKRSQMTSDFGVAAIDFQLADEVNMGDYHVRAQLGDITSDKTVSVKRYVLPKFKTDVKADKVFYMPKETLKVELQGDYFFGKPVASGKVKVTASTFDVAFKDFQTWEGKTDTQGHASFDIKLPDYFVGQPLAKGDAIVKLEVKLTDTADHTETITKTYPVSNSPIRVSLIPEGGRVVSGLENRIFVAATYPDGSPAVCDVKLWIHTPKAEPLEVPRLWGENKDQIDVAALLGVTATAVVGGGNEDKSEKKPAPTVLAKLTTNESGLAEFTIAPKPDQFRKAEWVQQNIELLGGQQHPWWGQKTYLDIGMEVNDKKGPAISFVTAINADPFGENVVLRLDKAIYKGGDVAQVDVRTSAGLPTVYLDVVKDGQTLLTKWIDVKDGKAAHKLDLPQTVFGTLEIHAYQMLSGGEILRDTRVVYVQPSADLKIDVQADKGEYLPGGEGKIRFTVTDASGKPTAAALGVIIVDEAVYALQEMQPGLEKVYFTLQEELLKPQAQAVYKPSEPIPVLIQQSELPLAKQQIAQALLAAVKPKAAPRWEVDPSVERRRKMEGQVQQIGWALMNYGMQHEALEYDKKTKKWGFKANLLEQLERTKMIAAELLKDPFGRPITVDGLATLGKGFTPDHLGQSVTTSHMQNIVGSFLQHTQSNRAKWFKDGKWSFPDGVLADAVKATRNDARWLKDAWGNEMKIVKRGTKWGTNPYGQNQLDYHEIVSAGPDGKFGTDDDVKLSSVWNTNAFAWWGEAELWMDGNQGRNRLGEMGLLGMQRGAARNLGMMMPMAAEGAPAGGGGFGGGRPAPMNAARPTAMPMKSEAKNGHAAEVDKKGGGGEGGAKPTRLREFFPETMLWNPSLITDDQGRAELPVQFADSITTWRLSASASSKFGSLGGVTAPMRVFQDFFVDLDLPVALTQNDEVAFPVAVYNYLKTPQTVKLELKQETWFDLVDDKGLARSLDLKPNEVTSIKYRIRAKKIGNHPLTVTATGSKMSDAIKRIIEIVPDGTKIEVVASDRLAGNVSKTITIPADSIEDASKIIVKIYPGVFSQVLEGTEGMLRLPGG